MNEPAYEFTESHPSRESYWRGIVLFGRNVASYKLALAKSLVELAEAEREEVSLDDLAVPFSRHLCEHLKLADKQATSPQSSFLDACRAFNHGDSTEEELVAVTAKLGFQNVIDAFHVVGNGPVPVRFFEDERKLSTGGIRLSDDLLSLSQRGQGDELSAEAEARWRLVETAWELNLPAHLLTVVYDPETELLLPRDLTRRKAITAARPALNGYQKGACFYCFGLITVVPGSPRLAQVDHFFPHILKPHRIIEPLDDVWNLVLACRECNAGVGGKFASVPALPYVERLHRRNEFLIGSHHPLRETLIAQTGPAEQARGDFLNRAYVDAKEVLLSTWDTPERAPAQF